MDLAAFPVQKVVEVFLISLFLSSGLNAGQGNPKISDQAPEKAEVESLAYVDPSLTTEVYD